MPSDLEWMKTALEEARRAAMHGDVPVGCVIVDADGSELARGENRREIDEDPTAHAEIVALRRAAARRGHWRLEGTTLYVTLEPCPMCAGALVNARVGRLVFGAADPKAGAVVSHYGIGTDDRLNHRYELVDNVASEDCVAELRAFFAELRARGEK